MTLGLSDVEGFMVPCPNDATEAEEIERILESIDRKINLHRQKSVVLGELFKSLLHGLVTGQIRSQDLDLPGLTGLPTTNLSPARSGRVYGRQTK